MNLCLNMIVRNEGERIERALKSAAPYIRSWVIIDTGSTDDTKERITKFFREWGIPGEIRDEPFEDFSQARNAALNWARTLAFAYQPTHILLMDADMELVVKDSEKFLGMEGGIAFEMYQNAGSLTYTNTRIITSIGRWGYKGVTHEYLDVPSTSIIPADVAMFVDHADGSNRADKYKRDIRLLKKGLKQEPNNARYFFYLAQSYRDAGKHLDAAKWFKRRIEAGGWDEEVWSARVGLAHALKDLGDEAGFIRELLLAYNSRPTRAEAMYDLAHHLREKGLPAAAHAMASAVAGLPKPKDRLFVNDYVYDVGVKDEMAITAFYVPGKLEEGRRINDALSLKPPYRLATFNARNNQYWYVRQLASMAPSFEQNQIAFTAPDDRVVLNPSICHHNGRFLVNVRAVNYVIDADGRYIIKATDGTANAENPIDTRNFVLDLGTTPSPHYQMDFECHRPDDMPVEYNLVTGFEDIRLWSHTDALWASATVRQLHADGNCEQVLSRLDATEDGNFVHRGMHRMLRSPRETEKNWSPILHDDGPIKFMWRPGIVVGLNGDFVVSNKSPILIDNLAGSSQVIPWWPDTMLGRGSNGWLAVVHTSGTLPNSHLRYYHHRFIEYTNDFKVSRVSLPFVFQDKTIEFCAGMCWWPAKDSLVLSYGIKDREAWLGTLQQTDVQRMLAEGHSYD